MTTIRFEVEVLGSHAHVKVRAGTDEEAAAGHMPLAGTLVFTPEQWDDLRLALAAGAAAHRAFNKPPEAVANIEIKERR